jgi:succinate-semialdehyde dehydrogenase/glutarate-semialdehyde dehydrogenase
MADGPGVVLQGLRDNALFAQRAFIGGEWKKAASGETVTVVNPANGQTIGTIPACGKAETREAISAAAVAFPAWRRKTAAERGAIVERWGALMIENITDLARIMTVEQGKPLAEAEGEIRYAASFLKWFAGEATRVGGHDVPAPSADRRILVMKEPVGVTAAITPWNFPAAMITRKAGAALAAGCPMVVKPSELTPFSALALAVLAERAGVPAGVLSIVTGLPQDIGAEMTSSPIVKKLSFTGSTRVGSLLMSQCAGTIKRVSLELGGNAPFIVFDDADLDLAIEGAMLSKFRNAGQTCVCSNRILVQAGIHDRFVDAFAAAVSKLNVGDGLVSGITTGPLINNAATAKVDAHLQDALSHGGKIAAQASFDADPKRFSRPTLLVGATTDMKVAQEETFGPLAPVFKFKTESEAVELANSTPFGLASYFYTNDLNRAWRIGERLEFGMVALNNGSVSMEVAPFGGVKMSGLGREGGREGIEEYLSTKAFHWGGLKMDLQ